MNHIENISTILGAASVQGIPKEICNRIIMMKRLDLLPKLADFQWFRYTGPNVWDVRPGVGKGFARKGNIIGAKPFDKSSVLWYDTIDLKIVKVPMDFAIRVAEFSTPLSVYRYVKEKTTDQAFTKEFAKAIFEWFEGEPVTSKEFYSTVTSWKPFRMTSNLYRAFVSDTEVGKKVRLSSQQAFYSASTSKEACLRAWQNWAEENNVKYKGKTVVLVQFSAPKVYADTKKLIPIVEQIELQFHMAVSGALREWKECWICPDQVGTVIGNYSADKLFQQYGW